ncbi:MAG: dienelactone hydrolase family protein, partial [Gemmatimonadota bacterium]|nr:dienelactone hydrolase family protein [Gemmatimonadota bacterium]
MIEKTIEVATSDGIMPAYVFHPEGEGPHPPVIFYFDIFGIRDELKNMCRRFARAGYYTVLPSLFYRMGNPSYNPEKFMIGGLNLEKTDPLHPMNLNTSTTNAMVIDDTGALLRHLDNEEPQANAQRVGTIGTCMGGRHALFAAATYPDHVLAF